MICFGSFGTGHQRGDPSLKSALPWQLIVLLRAGTRGCRQRRLRRHEDRLLPGGRRHRLRLHWLRRHEDPLASRRCARPLATRQWRTCWSLAGQPQHGLLLLYGRAPLLILKLAPQHIHCQRSEAVVVGRCSLGPPIRISAELEPAMGLELRKSLLCAQAVR